jgi:SAM-dependent methyltransferase
MCSEACIAFGMSHLHAEDVQDRTVLEVGARNVNGTLRSYVQALRPASYLGVDLRSGPGVDAICPAEELVQHYGSNTFDLVLSTEMLEHVRDWRRVVNNLKRVLKPGGVLLLTTRSKGYALHGYPNDFWRYEIPDIRFLFAEFSTLALMADPSEPGVFFKGRKPVRELSEPDLTSYALYSIIARRRTAQLSRLELLAFRIAVSAGRLLPESVKHRLRHALRF